MKTTRQQPRVRGVVRVGTHTALLPEINAALRALAKKYGVSVSWVKATILADQLKIRRQPRYYLQEVRDRRRKRA